MTFKSKVKVTVTFSTKKACNSAMLVARTLKLSRDVGPHQILRAKVKVTQTFSTRNLDNLAMLGARTLKFR